ncbi:MAG: putative DNA binding domain-containing protein [Sphaerochaetaceae bacterium]|nr:putative DNA binding domain-containing protein [Sphaerochaetaceae bacterium]
MEYSRMFENENLEFKEMVPEDSLKYTKTVVGFANGNGGLLVFGIRDSDHAVIGIPDDQLFVTIDRITNAISDSIEPLPDFSVSIMQENDRNLIAVETRGGSGRPYHIRSMGYENGTFIRIGGTTKLAEKELVSEWYFEKRNVSWDSLEYPAHEIGKSEMQAFQKACGNTISDSMMRSWSLAIEHDGKRFASNAFALLCGFYEGAPMVHCAVFRGKTRGEFLDKKILEGSLLDVYDQAVKFLKANTRMTAKISGQLRVETPEIPDSVLRELVVNAVVHRSYLSWQASYIAIYSDRIEVITPGGLPGRLTVEKVKQGFSKIRNRTLARVFMHLNLMDGYGMGIPAMIADLKKNGMREPLIEELEDSLRITIYRKGLYDEASSNDFSMACESKCLYMTSKDYAKVILQFIDASPEITTSELSQKTGLSLSTIKREVSKLQSSGALVRIGNNRRGIWKVEK